MSLTSLDPHSIDGLRRSPLGYRYRRPASDAQHRWQVVTALLFCTVLMLALVL